MKKLGNQKVKNLALRVPCSNASGLPQTRRLVVLRLPGIARSFIGARGLPQGVTAKPHWPLV